MKISLQAFYSATTADGCCKRKKKGRGDMMVHINGVETDGIQDNNHERPAFIHGQTRDAKRTYYFKIRRKLQARG